MRLMLRADSQRMDLDVLSNTQGPVSWPLVQHTGPIVLTFCPTHSARCLVLDLDVCPAHSARCLVLDLDVCPAHRARCLVLDLDVCPTHSARCLVMDLDVCPTRRARCFGAEGRVVRPKDSDVFRRVKTTENWVRIKMSASACTTRFLCTRRPTSYGSSLFVKYIKTAIISVFLPESGEQRYKKRSSV